MSEKKQTLVLGASDNPARYSFMAVEKLRHFGHPVKAIGRKHAFVEDVAIDTEKKHWGDIHTVTLYLNATHQEDYADYILSLAPKRIIFNPGAENPALENRAKMAGIETIEACTLVMLSTGQY